LTWLVGYPAITIIFPINRRTFDLQFCRCFSQHQPDTLISEIKMHNFNLGLGTHLLSRYLDQETAKGSFRSSSQAATCYFQSNHSKVEVITLSALPKDTRSELAGLSPH